jgi:hypothetical protein
MRYALLLAGLLASGIAVAETPSDRPPEMPPVPEGAAVEDEAPAITIKPTGEGMVEEYRIRGKLYMLKVTPRVGRPYFLVDPTGDGHFVHRDFLDSGFRPPMWVIREF